LVYKPLQGEHMVRDGRGTVGGSKSSAKWAVAAVENELHLF